MSTQALEPRDGEPEVWSPRYQNPKADVVFRSTDGMLFKVFAWDLARER